MLSFETCFPASCTAPLHPRPARAGGELLLSRRTCMYQCRHSPEEALYNPQTRLRATVAGSLKWDAYGGRDVIPLWVADMDLKTSPAIIDAVKKRVDHGIFGYSFPTEGAKTAVMDYYKASRQILSTRSLFSFSASSGRERCRGERLSYPPGGELVPNNRPK